MHEDFRALLLADSGVTNIAGDRVNFGEHPQGLSFPAIVLSTPSYDEGLHMNGKGPVTARMQVDSYANTYSECVRLALSASLLLHTYRGGRFIFIDAQESLTRREKKDNEIARIYRTEQDFNVTWRTD